MDDVLIPGNTIYYPGQAFNMGAPVGINGSVTGLINHLTITDNHLFNTATNSGDPGIFLISAGLAWTIAHNTIDGAKQIPSIFGLSGNQHDVTVDGNILFNCGYVTETNILSTFGGNIQLQGINNTVTNNRSVHCPGRLYNLAGTNNTATGLNHYASSQYPLPGQPLQLPNPVGRTGRGRQPTDASEPR